MSTLAWEGNIRGLRTNRVENECTCPSRRYIDCYRVSNFDDGVRVAETCSSMAKDRFTGQALLASMRKTANYLV